MKVTWDRVRQVDVYIVGCYVAVVSDVFKDIAVALSSTQAESLIVASA